MFFRLISTYILGLSLFFNTAFYLFFPNVVLADIVLYACTIKGHTTLQSFSSKNCETLKEYHYKSHAKSTSSDLKESRKGELTAIDAIVPPIFNENSSEKRYENIDERIGWSLLRGYVDTRNDKCAYFTAMLNDAQSYIDVKMSQNVIIGPHRSQELLTQIGYAQAQVNYYCGF